MSVTFDKLKELLAKQAITQQDIEKMIAEHGPMTEEETVQIAAEQHEKEREKQETITMEQYLEAAKVLDTASEGSPEYEKALKIVEKYESGQ
jgi:hypothetical protein